MKKNFKKVNAAILVIGNEILSGRTQDLNVSFISKWLNEKNGISVNEVRIIPDDEKTLAQTLAALLVEAAMADGEIDDVEYSHIQHMLISQLDLEKDDATTLLVDESDVDDRNVTEFSIGYAMSDNATLSLKYASDEVGDADADKYMWVTLNVNP